MSFYLESSDFCYTRKSPEKTAEAAEAVRENPVGYSLAALDRLGFMDTASSQFIGKCGACYNSSNVHSDTYRQIAIALAGYGDACICRYSLRLGSSKEEEDESLFYADGIEDYVIWRMQETLSESNESDDFNLVIPIHLPSSMFGEGPKSGHANSLVARVNIERRSVLFSVHEPTGKNIKQHRNTVASIERVLAAIFKHVGNSGSFDIKQRNAQDTQKTVGIQMFKPHHVISEEPSKETKKEVMAHIETLKKGGYIGGFCTVYSAMVVTAALYFDGRFDVYEIEDDLMYILIDEIRGGVERWYDAANLAYGGFDSAARVFSICMMKKMVQNGRPGKRYRCCKLGQQWVYVEGSANGDIRTVILPH